MPEYNMLKLKDLGIKAQVLDSLPYAVVGGSWEGSFSAMSTLLTSLIHIVPNGTQLKLLFLRVWTQNSDGATFSIVQSNPTATGATGTVEAYPVLGAVPSGTRDYPMLEAAGAEVLRGGLRDPVHVLEGSITFNVLYKHPIGTALTGDRTGIVWWGLQAAME